MKSPICLLFCFMLLIGCDGEHKLTFETITYSEKECPGCPQVHIAVPKVLNQSHLSNTVNTVLKEELITLLIFDDDVEAASIDEAVESFKNGFEELRRLYPAETTEWKAKIDGEVTFEDKNILTITLKSYIFTGGAHGYSSQRFLNFDKRKGKEFENRELFKKQDGFKRFAETKFRLQEGIPQDSPINSTGFMFEGDKFHLPENIGFTESGLTLLYNQYEVASYADGAIALTLPYTEVKSFLSKKIKL